VEKLFAAAVHKEKGIIIMEEIKNGDTSSFFDSIKYSSRIFIYSTTASSHEDASEKIIAQHIARIITGQ